MDLLIRQFVTDTLAEDIGRGDLFAQCSEPAAARAHILAKEPGVLAGVRYAGALERLAGVSIRWDKRDGEAFESGERLAVIEGEDTTLLSIERTLLNMLQHASGIATNASRFSRLLSGSSVELLDTRKTRPKLRAFEKYAVRCGGVVNHRMGLDDSLMLKDTHLKRIGDLAAFIAGARKKIPFTSTIEVECETVKMAETALKAGADIIMCDNMDIETVSQVIRLRAQLAPGVRIEVSGNINEETLAGYRELEVDAVSSGSIIHQARWLDLSMKMQ